MMFAIALFLSRSRANPVPPGRVAPPSGWDRAEVKIMHPPSDPLDSLLDRWREAPEPPPHLTTEVWRRIAVVDNRAERPGLFFRIEAVFMRPSFAAAFIAACMLLGLFLAEVRLARLHAERGTQIAQSYLRLIDPLLDKSAVKVAAREP